MRKFFRWCVVVSACTLILPYVKAEDAKKTDTPPASQYYSAGDITIKLKSANSTSITIQGAQPMGGKGGKGGTRPAEPDLTIELTADAKVRMLHLPPLEDEKGKKIARSADELQKLKGNSNLPGYHAEISDLKAGQIVQVHLFKLKGAKGEDAKKSFASRITIVSEPTVGPGDAKKPEKKVK